LSVVAELVPAMARGERCVRWMLDTLRDIAVRTARATCSGISARVAAGAVGERARDDHGVE
jgi:hypothetical protein